MKPVDNTACASTDVVSDPLFTCNGGPRQTSSRVSDNPQLRLGRLHINTSTKVWGNPQLRRFRINHTTQKVSDNSHFRRLYLTDNSEGFRYPTTQQVSDNPQLRRRFQVTHSSEGVRWPTTPKVSDNRQLEMSQIRHAEKTHCVEISVIVVSGMEAWLHKHQNSMGYMRACGYLQTLEGLECTKHS